MCPQEERRFLKPSCYYLHDSTAHNVTPTQSLICSASIDRIAEGPALSNTLCRLSALCAEMLSCSPCPTWHLPPLLGTMGAEMLVSRDGWYDIDDGRRVAGPARTVDTDKRRADRCRARNFPDVPHAQLASKSAGCSSGSAPWHSSGRTGGDPGPQHS